MRYQSNTASSKPPRRAWVWAVAATYILFWLGWRAELYTGNRWFGLVLLASVATGSLIGRWWALALSLVPVLLGIGAPDDDAGAPAFAVILEFYTPGLAVALGLGVCLAKLAGVVRHSKNPRPSGRAT